MISIHFYADDYSALLKVFTKGPSQHELHNSRLGTTEDNSFIISELGKSLVAFISYKKKGDNFIQPSILWCTRFWRIKSHEYNQISEPTEFTYKAWNTVDAKNLGIRDHYNPRAMALSRTFTIYGLAITDIQYLVWTFTIPCTRGVQ